MQRLFKSEKEERMTCLFIFFFFIIPHSAVYVNKQKRKVTLSFSFFFLSPHLVVWRDKTLKIDWCRLQIDSE